MVAGGGGVERAIGGSSGVRFVLFRYRNSPAPGPD